MSRRHDPIPALTVETAPVYRCGDGRRYLQRHSAYMRAAVDAYWECYGDPDESGPPYYHEADGAKPGGADHLKRTTTRLARWLRWRDGRRAATARQR